LNDAAGLWNKENFWQAKRPQLSNKPAGESAEEIIPVGLSRQIKLIPPPNVSSNSTWFQLLYAFAPPVVKFCSIHGYCHGGNLMKPPKNVGLTPIETAQLWLAQILR